MYQTTNNCGWTLIGGGGGGGGGEGGGREGRGWGGGGEGVGRGPPTLDKLYLLYAACLSVFKLLLGN